MRKLWRRRLLAVLALAALVTACAAGPAREAGEAAGQPVYFLAVGEEAEGQDAIQVSYEALDLAEDASSQEIAEAVVERLLAGGGHLRSPLPAGTELLGVEIRDRVAYVDLSGHIANLSGVDLSLADYCLTLSLTALDGVSAVRILCQGRSLGQQPKQIFYERDVLLSTRDDVLQTVEVTLFFRNEAGALAGERRCLDLYEGQTLAENLVTALLEGPSDRSLSPVIPEGFQVNSVRVEDGVCYVNLPASSLEGLPEEEHAQQQILWSLADSLYSLETVESIRFLSGGQELTRFGGIPVESVSSRPQG
mgnify:CR=1 FL=1